MNRAAVFHLIRDHGWLWFHIAKMTPAEVEAEHARQFPACAWTLEESE